MHLKHFRNNNGNVVYNFLNSGEKTEFKMSVKEYRNIQRSRKSMISRKHKNKMASKYISNQNKVMD